MLKKALFGAAVLCLCVFQTNGMGKDRNTKPWDPFAIDIALIDSGKLHSFKTMEMKVLVKKNGSKVRMYSLEISINMLLEAITKELRRIVEKETGDKIELTCGFKAFDETVYGFEYGVTFMFYPEEARFYKNNYKPNEEFWQDGRYIAKGITLDVMLEKLEYHQKRRPGITICEILDSRHGSWGENHRHVSEKYVGKDEKGKPMYNYVYNYVVNKPDSWAFSEPCSKSYYDSLPRGDEHVKKDVAVLCEDI
ncbi:MAG: hypothetical protein LBT63_03450 [Holosporaceae bacterium]|jgi:hypothetical protein|nr:hypothetical protein [Holosporaceae bacterium]